MSQSTAVEELLAAADNLTARLAQDPLPVAVTALGGGFALTLDSDGILRDVRCDAPTTPPAATQALNALVRAAGEALLDPQVAPPPGIFVTPVFDSRRPVPSVLDRLGAGTDDGFSWEQVHAALADVRGEGRTPHARVTVVPGGAVETIAVTALPEYPEEVAAAVLVAARLAAQDAARAVRARVADGHLDPRWAVTRLLSSDPYQEA